MHLNRRDDCNKFCHSFQNSEQSLLLSSRKSQFSQANTSGQSICWLSLLSPRWPFWQYPKSPATSLKLKPGFWSDAILVTVSTTLILHFTRTTQSLFVQLPNISMHRVIVKTMPTPNKTAQVSASSQRRISGAASRRSSSRNVTTPCAVSCARQTQLCGLWKDTLLGMCNSGRPLKLALQAALDRRPDMLKATAGPSRLCPKSVDISPGYQLQRGPGKLNFRSCCYCGAARD